MQVWLLDKPDNFHSYEVERFVSEAKQSGIYLLIVAPEDFEILVDGVDNRNILYKGIVVEQINCLLPRLGSGATYFSLATVRQFAQMGVFILNSVRSIEIGRDKLATMQTLARKNIPIPKTILAKFPLNIEVVNQEFSYPLIIKPVSSSRGKGVFLCQSSDQLEDLLELIEVSKGSHSNVIIQEFISTSWGKDIRIIVIGGRAIGAMLRKSAKGKVKANYSAGGTVAPFELNPAIEWLAVESANAVGLDIAGVDLLFDGESYKVCEVNCSPGFKGFEIATGLNVPAEIFNFINVRLGGASISDNNGYQE